MFVGGLALLLAGAELLVRGASRLALAAGVSPLVVGLTVVAYGTGAPEVVVTAGAGLSGQAGVALGNVVGSNVFNSLVVLGLSALVAPLVVDEQLVRWDIPLMILASVGVLLLALDGRIGRWDGAGLLLGLVLYTVVTLWRARRNGPAPTSGGSGRGSQEGPWWRGWPWDLVIVGAGLGLLVLGAAWFVDAAVATARVLGVGELVIGLTVVAAGTSLPEVATSMLAAARGQRAIAVGNVIGSNIFNLLGVMGLGSILPATGIPVPLGALTFDLPVMLAVALAILPVTYTGLSFSRWEGAVFGGYYVAYTSYLILDATGHAGRDALRDAILGFAVPLTVLVFVVAVVRDRMVDRRRRAR